MHLIDDIDPKNDYKIDSRIKLALLVLVFTCIVMQLEALYSQYMFVNRDRSSSILICFYDIFPLRCIVDILSLAGSILSLFVVMTNNWKLPNGDGKMTFLLMAPLILFFVNQFIINFLFDVIGY